jgi:CheY-like chemotaxis protein
MTRIATLLAAAAVCAGTLTNAADDMPSGASAPRYSARVINPKLAHGIFEARTRTFFVCGTDGAVLRSEDGVAWVQAETPTMADLTRLSADSRGRVLVAVGKNGAILRSENSGRSWALAANDTTSTDLNAVIQHARSGTWLAAGTNGVILRSRDEGKSWKSLGQGVSLTFHTLFVDPSRDAIFVGGDEGIIGRSLNGGESFQVKAIEMEEPRTPITQFFEHGGRLIATSALGRLLISEDGGSSWNVLKTGTGAFFTGGAFDPDSKSFVLTSHTGDVFRSLNVDFRPFKKLKKELEETLNYRKSEGKKDAILVFADAACFLSHNKHFEECEILEWWWNETTTEWRQNNQNITVVCPHPGLVLNDPLLSDTKGHLNGKHTITIDLKQSHENQKRKSKRILIAEPNSDIRVLYSLFTKQHGFSISDVSIVENGNKCLEILLSNTADDDDNNNNNNINDNDYDIIILDTHLPDISGFEVARKIRDRLPHKKIILTTTHSLDNISHIIDSIGIKSEDVILKPFVFSELFSTLKEPRMSYN